MTINFTGDNGLNGMGLIDLTAFIGSLFGTTSTAQDSGFYWVMEGYNDFHGKKQVGTNIILDLKNEKVQVRIVEGFDKDESVTNKCYTLIGYCKYHNIDFFLNEWE